MAISIPGPRQVSLSSDVDGGRTSPPADPSQGCSSRQSATSRVLPALRLPLPWFPTEYAAQLLPLSHDAAQHCCTAHCPDGPSLYIFLASVHLGLVLRSASLSVHQWSRMLLFANHHLTLSVGICWNSGTELEPAHGEESRTRRATKCGIERETREPAGTLVWVAKEHRCCSVDESAD